MRILLWAPFGAGTHYWGPGTSAYRLFSNNRDSNIKITVIHASKFQQNFPDTYFESIKLGNIDEKGFFQYFKYLLSSCLWIKKNHNKYDAFYGVTAYFYTFLPAIFFKKLNKKAKVFIKISGINGGFKNNSKFSKILGFSNFRLKNANNLTGYISISSDISSSLIDNNIDAEKIFYIPNGVDVRRFHKIDRSEKRILRLQEGFKDVFTLVYVGGLTFNKNVIETVKALNMLKIKGYDIQFLIVGPDRSEGFVEKELMEYISKHKLNDICFRIEHTVEPEKFFKLGDVFILNSRFEGLSNSLLEALASGLPCIAYPASGTVDLIEEGLNGFFTDGLAEQIVEKIQILFGNDELYHLMSFNAREKIINSYSVDYVLEKTFSLLKK